MDTVTRKETVRNSKPFHGQLPSGVAHTLPKSSRLLGCGRTPRHMYVVSGTLTHHILTLKRLLF